MLDSSAQEEATRPRSSPGGLPALRFDAFGTAQALGALLFGILLFAVPLYLWRRPRGVQVPPHSDAALPESIVAAAGHDAAAAVLSPSVAVASEPAVKLADARVLECHDRGPTRTVAEQCDHIAAFEKALADAIEASHECVPPDAGAGAIQFVADLSFARRRHPVTVTLPRDGRSFQSPKIVKDCAAGVRARLTTFPVTALQHAHGRYKISVLASYGAPTAQ